MRIGIALAVVFLAAGIAVAAPPAADSAYEPDLLDVKFREGTKVRLRDGRPTDVENRPAVRADLQGILQAVAQGTWDRTHSVDEKVLDRLRTEGQANRANPLPDLANYFRLRVPRGMTAVRAKEILERFDSVEAAYRVPRPVEPPLPPDYSSPAQPVYQDYLDAAPWGIDARYAWSWGLTGAGVKVCDIEYGVNRNHLDLPPVTFVGRIPIDYFEDDHGTSVIGIVASQDDGAGTIGIAHGAQPFFAGALTDLGYNVARPLMECGAALAAGDIVLVEQQMSGPYGGNLWVPPEWSKPVYDAIVTLVANGIVVVETTGNGGQNLDAPLFSVDNDGHWPFLIENDSGAILVTGAQSPHQATPRSYHPWSNYGATVDLQGWGDSIVTTGYGGLYDAEGENLLYRSGFGGSSGAAPMVVGAVALVQQLHQVLYGTPAPPSFVKHLLVSTGTPQTGARHLGPLPDLQNALNALMQVYYVDDTATGANDGTSWENAFRELQEALHAATPGARILVAEGYYWPDWDPVTNSITGNRADAFQLKNGVTLLGGYPNGGGIRNPATYASVLSGDIGEPITNTDNSYHVVTAGAALDDSAVIDGFRIWSANADGPYPHDRGAGILITGGSPVLRGLHLQWSFASIGTGIYNENGSPSLQDVVIAFNRATTGGGGGMWNQGGGPRLTDVLFLDNGAAGEGGGLFTHGGSPHIERTIFAGNFGTRGGGISNWPGSSLVLDSVEFRRNQATVDIGGAIMNWLGQLRLNNVTMNGNVGAFGPGGIYLFDPDTVTIRNSIIWENTGGNVGGALAAVSNSLIQGGYPGTNVIDGDPLFRKPGVDLRLKKGSPGLNAGDPSTCAAVDVRGVFREGTCDMGAYEYRGNPGTFWSNGEVDLLHAGESFDSTPVGGPIRQSADNFVVPAGQVCDVSSFRGVLQDGTNTSEAVADLYADSFGLPGDPIASWSVHGTCAHDPSMACGEAADCPVGGVCDYNCRLQGNNCAGNLCVSSCAIPGQSLGSRGNGRLWEPRFDNVDTRLGSGTYWLSIHGTSEPGSPGATYSISAGETTVPATPYLFREVGFGWVNGGPFFGDAPRDLALEVDAVCLADADGDLSPVGEDCDDDEPNRFPGNPEVCDFIDNDCDGAADYGFPPFGSPTLFFSSRAQFFWIGVDTATAYDIVRGDLGLLRTSAGDFTNAVCAADEVAGDTYDIGDGIPHGLGVWYLVRATNAICGAGTYDEFNLSQVQSRDAEIAASPNACP